MAQNDRSGRLTVSPLYYLLQMLWAVLRTVLMVCLSFVILYPFLYSLSMAVRSVEDVYDPSVIWLPIHFTLDNFTAVIEATDYFTVLRNSLILTLGCALLQTFTCSLVGYGFGRFTVRGKKLLFVLMLLTIMIPAQIIALPTYIKLKDFDILGLFRLLFGHGIPLLGSPAAFFLMAFFGMGIRSGLFILILRQCYTAMPGELEDAAAVDGCGAMRTYFRIMLPNAKNSLLTVFLFSVVWYWNDYYLSSIYLTDYPTVSTTLANLRGRLEMILSSEVVYDPYQIATMMQAGCLLTVGLLVIVYLFTQKWFTQGITASGIVG